MYLGSFVNYGDVVQPSPGDSQDGRALIEVDTAGRPVCCMGEAVPKLLAQEHEL
jgi:hypothetical protein